MQVSDPQRERIGFGVLFREKNSDIVGIIPGEFSWHVSSLIPGVSAPLQSRTTARSPANAEPSQLRDRNIVHFGVSVKASNAKPDRTVGKIISGAQCLQHIGGLNHRRSACRTA